jgi:hypothetical protein
LAKWDSLDDLYPVYDLKTLESYKLDPSHYIAGNGFIRKGGGCLLVGATGMGKSVLAEQIGLCVAAGKDLFDVVKVHGARKVHYIQAENDEDVMQRDIISIVKNLKLDRKLVQKNFTMRHVFGLSDESFAEYLTFDIARHKPELIVIDHYQAYTDGDLNKAEVFKRWITPIDEMLKAHSIGLLLVVHKGKPKDVQGWDIRELVYQQMGTSAQANWARTAIEIRPAKNDVRRFDLIFTKNADRAGIKDENGQTQRHLYVEHSDDSSTPYWQLCEVQAPEVTVNYEKMIVEAAHEHVGKSMRWLAKELGCSVGVVQKYYPPELRPKKEEQ